MGAAADAPARARALVRGGASYLTFTSVPAGRLHRTQARAARHGRGHAGRGPLGMDRTPGTAATPRRRARDPARRVPAAGARARHRRGDRDPQYQDYVFRAKVANAIAAAGRCSPWSSKRGSRPAPAWQRRGWFCAPGDYAAAGALASVDAGPMQDSGACAPQLTLRATGSAGPGWQAAVARRVDPGSGGWTWYRKSPKLAPPRDCRG